MSGFRCQVSGKRELSVISNWVLVRRVAGYGSRDAPRSPVPSSPLLVLHFLFSSLSFHLPVSFALAFPSVLRPFFGNEADRGQVPITNTRLLHVSRVCARHGVVPVKRGLRYPSALREC